MDKKSNPGRRSTADKKKTVPNRNSGQKPKQVQKKGTTPKKKNNTTRKNSPRRVKKVIKGPTRGYIIFLLAVTAIFLFYIVGFLLTILNKTELQTMLLEETSLDTTKVYNGMIFRDEKVYSSANTGIVNFSYENKEFVAKNRVLAYVSDQAEVESLEKEVEEVNTELFKLQSFREQYSMTKGDIENINKKMAQDISHFKIKEYGDIYELRNGIDREISIRNNILFSDSRLNSDKNMEQRLKLEQQLKNSKYTISSENSGVLIYDLDGFEEVASVENMKEITKKQTEMETTTEKNDLIVSDIDEKVFKVIENNEWYVGVYFPVGEIKNIKEGDYKTLYMGKGNIYEPINCKVEFVRNEDKETYVIFNTMKNMLDYVDQRFLDVKLTNDTTTAFKIPKSAITTRNILKIPLDYISGQPEVVIKRLEDGTTVTSKIIPWKISEDGKYQMILKENNDLKIGDTLLLPNSKDQTYQISFAEDVQGVYFANNGIATFRKIEVDDTLPNTDDYIYIKNTNNIQEQDRIVFDATDVIDGQIIN